MIAKGWSLRNPADIDSTGRLAHSPGAGRADDNVKSRRQARPCAPRARYTSGGHGNTADDGTCNLRRRLRLRPPVRVRPGVDERRNERRNYRDDEWLAHWLSLRDE